MHISPIVYAIPVFLLTVIVEGAILVWKRPGAFDLADALGSLNLGVLSQLSGVWVKLLGWGFYIEAFNAFHLPAWSMASLPAWIAALIFYDFCYYWVHRCGHEVAIMWAAHSVHHSSEYYNLTTALRQTSTGFLISWIFYIPMALAGVPPAMFFVVGLIDLLYQYWVHTELVGRLGVVDRILVTPSNHRVHHGQNDYCLDKNYGGILILWDRLFGTFVDERDGEKIIYGVRKPLNAYNPVWGNLQVYRDLWRESARAPGLWPKLRVWLAPPGGGSKSPAPFDPAAFKRYGPPVTAGLRAYVVTQYILGNLLLVVFLIKADTLGALAWPWGGLIAWGLFTQGRLLEGARGARAVEIARWAVWVAVLALAPQVLGVQIAEQVRITLSLAALTGAGWLWLTPAAEGRPA
jgi:alkylglycerol monooxygenase